MVVREDTIDSRDAPLSCRCCNGRSPDVTVSSSADGWSPFGGHSMVSMDELYPLRTLPWNSVGPQMERLIASASQELLGASRTSAKAPRVLLFRTFRRTVSRHSACNSVIRSLQLQGKPLSKQQVKDLRRHFHSLPPSYAQALYSGSQVLLHQQIMSEAECTFPFHNSCSSPPSPSSPPFALHIQQTSRSIPPSFSRSLSWASTSIEASAWCPSEIGGSLNGVTGSGTPALSLATTMGYSTSATESCSMSVATAMNLDTWTGSSSEKTEPVMFDLVFAVKRPLCRRVMLSVLAKAQLGVVHFNVYPILGGGVLGVARLAVSPDDADLADVEDVVRLAVQRGSKLLKEPAKRFGGLSLKLGGSGASGLIRQASAGWDAGSASSLHESPSGMLRVLVADGLGIISGEEELQRWMLDPVKLKIGERVAVGSSGEVFRGRYGEEEVAVKVLRSSKGPTKMAAEFRREVLALSLLKHDNVVPFLGLCINTARRMCIVTKFMSGGSLLDVIARRAQQGAEGLPLSQVLSIAMDTVAGMQFLHQHGIIHRDLKTANILLDASGTAKLADFGVSRLCGEKGEMTAEVGTYRWMAPEALDSGGGGSGVTHKSDIYSFGIVLWELVTGKVPYAGYTPMQAAVGVALHGLRPTIPPSCPPALRSLMERCWAARQEDRPDLATILMELKAMRASWTC